MNNNTYIFFLGRQSLLSLSEIFSCYGNEYIDVQRDFLVKELDNEFKQSDLHSLGGIIKVARVVHTCNRKGIDEHALAELLVEKIFPEPGAQSKWRYAVNIFGKKSYNLSKVLNYSKKEAKKQKIAVRFVNKNLQKNISSVVVRKEKLIEKGADINICVIKDTIYISLAVACQDFESYGERDFGKPTRDMKGGIMPPKLAQMMLNIAVGKKKDMSIYDPFCGSGTLVMEGMLQGHSMTGSDIDRSIVDKAKENVAWLLKEFAFRKPKEPTLFVHDAQTKATDIFEMNALVSESYLGPTLTNQLSPAEQDAIHKEVAHMHKQFFAHAKGYLTKDGCIVISFPFYNNNGKYRFIENLLDPLKELGYTPDVLVPMTVFEQLGYTPSKRKSLLYLRKEQKVGREIFRFRRTR